MLTEAEKKWLEKRAVESCETCRDPDELFCSLCSRDPRPKSLSADFFSMSGCAMTTNWQDAAEFEARVAEKLANCDGAFQPCHRTRCPEGANSAAECIPCRLKYARLKVEAEMEENHE